MKLEERVVWHYAAGDTWVNVLTKNRVTFYNEAVMPGSASDA